MLPAAVIAAGALAQPLRSIGLALLAAALAPQLIALPAATEVASFVEANVHNRDHATVAAEWTDANLPILRGDRPVVVIDAVLAGGLTHIEREPGDWLRANAREGKILISTVRNDAAAVMIRSGLPVSRFIHEGNKPYFTDELHLFGEHADWIVYQPLSPNDAFHPQMARAEPPGFQLVFDNINFQIFRRETGAEDFAKPEAVPDSADTVREPRTLGVAAPPAVTPLGLQHVFRSLSCAGDVLTVVTSRETLYADLSCSRYGLLDATAVPMRNLPVHIRIEPGTPALLLVETADAGRIELPVGRVWMDMRGLKPVHSAARALRSDVTFGPLPPSTENSTQVTRSLFSITCHNEVVSVVTNREIISAEFFCEDLPAWKQFQRRTVQVSVSTGKHRSLRVSGEAGSIVMDNTGRAWVEGLRPSGVPSTARLGQRDLAPAGDADAAELPRLFSLRCADDIAALTTTREVFYVEYPCVRLPRSDRLGGKLVLVSVEAGGTSTLGVAAGQDAIALEVDRVWIDPH
jgi:hypothetical protein